jgi:hypothetical protein
MYVTVNMSLILDNIFGFFRHNVLEVIFSCRQVKGWKGKVHICVYYSHSHVWLLILVLQASKLL